MSVQVDVQRACDNETVPDNSFVTAWLTRSVAEAGRPADAELSVRIVNEDEMRSLNCAFRGKDKPTNVLSFPAGDVAGLPADAPLPLGDIVICAGVVSAEAAAQGKTEDDHWAHMLVHGTLHLLGFDHETDAEAADMEALETRILGEHGIADPYGAAARSC